MLDRGQAPKGLSQRTDGRIARTGTRCALLAVLGLLAISFGAEADHQIATPPGVVRPALSDDNPDLSKGAKPTAADPLRRILASTAPIDCKMAAVALNGALIGLALPTPERRWAAVAPTSAESRRRMAACQISLQSSLRR